MGKRAFKSVLAKFVVSLLLILWLLASVNLNQVLSLLKSFSTFLLLEILLLTLVAWGLTIYRWFVLLSGFSFWRLTEQTFIANFYSLVLPGQIAGEIVKAYRLGREVSDTAHIGASILVDKLVSLLGLLVVAVMGLLTSKIYVPKEISISIGLFTLFFFVGFFCLKVPVVFRIIVSALRWTGKRWSRFRHAFLQVSRLLDAWRNLLNQPFRLFYAFLLGVVFQLVGIWITVLLAHELKLDLPFADWCWIFGVVSIAVLLPISIGGIGVREGVFAGVLSLQSVPIEKSVTLSLAVFGVSLIGALIGGVLELFRSMMPPSISN